jgi:hypothetical protein
MNRRDMDLRAICARLESLMHVQPTGEDRVEVAEALHSKWEGVQVWAGRCLSAWGDDRSAQALRGWLESTLTKEAGWAVRGEAIRALCRCYRPQDVGWLLDLYFGATDHLLRHEFLAAITELPLAKVRRRIARESRHPDPERREAADIAGRRLGSWLQYLARRSNKALQPTSRARLKAKSRKRSNAARG